VLLSAEVSSESTSYPGGRRGTRLNKVDPDTPWTNSTSPNNSSKYYDTINKELFGGSFLDLPLPLHLTYHPSFGFTQK